MPLLPQPVLAHARHEAPPTESRLLRATPLGAAVVTLSELLEERGINHAFLRGHQDLPRVRSGGDVDLTIARADLPAFRQALSEALFRHRAHVLDQFTAPGLRQFHLHARSEDGEHDFLDLDLHVAETCYGVPFLKAQRLLAHPRREGTVPSLAPGIAAWIDLLGAYLSGGKVRDGYRVALLEHRDNEATRRLGRRLFGRVRCSALLSALADPEALHARARGDRRALLARRLVRAPFSVLLGCLGLVWALRIRPLYRPRGRTVAFLGTDGTGKTTILDQVRELVGPAFRSDDNSLLKLRPGWLPQLDRVLHLGKTTQGPKDWARPHRARPSGRIISNVRVLYYGLDYLLGYWLKIAPRRRRNSLIVFDRWFDDFLIDPKRCRIRPGTLSAKLLAKILPQPDRVIVVTAALGKVRARKQELTEDETARQLTDYEALARRGGRYHLICNNGTVEAAVSATLDALFGRGDCAEAPYGLESWYPFTRHPVRGWRTLEVHRRVDRNALETLWRHLERGEAMVVREPGLLRRFPISTLGLTTSRLPDLFQQDTWWVLPGTGGSHTLLSTSVNGFRHGLGLLPAGRARWRVARRLLHLGARFVGVFGWERVHVLVRGGGEDLQPLGPSLQPGHVSVALGVPGRYRKAIARVCDMGGHPLGVFKMPLTVPARAQIQREGESLAEVEALNLTPPVSPRLLGVGPGDWVLQEDLGTVRGSNEPGSQHLSLLSRLAAATRKDVGLRDLFSYQDSRDRVASLEGMVDRGWLDSFHGLAQAIAAQVHGPVACCMAHGDFTPWNLVETSEGLRALDWEFSLSDAPLLNDLCHFHLQTGILVLHHDAATLLRRFEESCAGPWCDHISQLGVSRPLLHLALYLLDQATFDEAVNQIERPPFAQVVWLREARQALANILVARLRSEGGA